MIPSRCIDLTPDEQTHGVQRGLFALQVERRRLRRPLSAEDAREVLSSVVPGAEVVEDGDRLLVAYRGVAYFSVNRGGHIEWVASSVPSPETPPIGSPAFARGRQQFNRGVVCMAALRRDGRRPLCAIRPRVRASDASTPSSRLSRFSTRRAHDAQVMPLIGSSTRSWAGALVMRPPRSRPRRPPYSRPRRRWNHPRR